MLPPVFDKRASDDVIYFASRTFTIKVSGNNVVFSISLCKGVNLFWNDSKVSTFESASELVPRAIYKVKSTS